MFHRASLDVMFGRGGMAAVRVAAQPCFLPSLRAAQTGRHGAVFGSWESHGGGSMGSGVTLFVARARGGEGRQAGRSVSESPTPPGAPPGAVPPRAARCKTEPEGFASLTACSMAV